MNDAALMAARLEGITACERNAVLERVIDSLSCECNAERRRHKNEERALKWWHESGGNEGESCMREALGLDSKIEGSPQKRKDPHESEGRRKSGRRRGSMRFSKRCESMEQKRDDSVVIEQATTSSTENSIGIRQCDIDEMIVASTFKMCESLFERSSYQWCHLIWLLPVIFHGERTASLRILAAVIIPSIRKRRRKYAFKIEAIVEFLETCSVECLTYSERVSLSETLSSAKNLALAEMRCPDLHGESRRQLLPAAMLNECRRLSSVGRDDIGSLRLCDAFELSAQYAAAAEHRFEISANGEKGWQGLFHSLPILVEQLELEMKELDLVDEEDLELLDLKPHCVSAGVYRQRIKEELKYQLETDVSLSYAKIFPLFSDIVDLNNKLSDCADYGTSCADCGEPGNAGPLDLERFFLPCFERWGRETMDKLNQWAIDMGRNSNQGQENTGGLRCREGMVEIYRSLFDTVDSFQKPASLSYQSALILENCLTGVISEHAKGLAKTVAGQCSGITRLRAPQRTFGGKKWQLEQEKGLDNIAYNLNDLSFHRVRAASLLKYLESVTSLLPESARRPHQDSGPLLGDAFKSLLLELEKHYIQSLSLFSDIFIVLYDLDTRFKDAILVNTTRGSRLRRTSVADAEETSLYKSDEFIMQYASAMEQSKRYLGKDTLPFVLEKNWALLGKIVGKVIDGNLNTTRARQAGLLLGRLEEYMKNLDGNISEPQSVREIRMTLADIFIRPAKERVGVLDTTSYIATCSSSF